MIQNRLTDLLTNHRGQCETERTGGHEIRITGENNHCETDMIPNSTVVIQRVMKWFRQNILRLQQAGLNTRTHICLTRIDAAGHLVGLGKSSWRGKRLAGLLEGVRKWPAGSLGCWMGVGKRHAGRRKGGGKRQAEVGLRDGGSGRRWGWLGGDESGWGGTGMD